MCACVYGCMNVCMYVWADWSVCLPVCTCVDVCQIVGLCVWVYERMCVCIYVCVICNYGCMCACMYGWLNVYIPACV